MDHRAEAKAPGTQPLRRTARRYRSHRGIMPRDDFARLERRWRQRPMFLPRRRRLWHWPIVIALFALSAAFGATLLDRNQVVGLVVGLEEAFNLGADAPYPKAASTATSNQ